MSEFSAGTQQVFLAPVLVPTSLSAPPSPSPFPGPWETGWWGTTCCLSPSGS